MQHRAASLKCLVLLACLLWTGKCWALPQIPKLGSYDQPVVDAPNSDKPVANASGSDRPLADARASEMSLAPASVNLESVSPLHRDKVRTVVEKPTLRSPGPVETFYCQPSTYHWLLDHPDRAVQMWRKLGAKCADIINRGDGRFGWKDDQGSDVSWETVVRDRGQRVWYAEGVVRPGRLLPLVSVQAIFILNFVEGRDRSGRPALRHQGELILHTDGRAAALATRIVGASAPRLAQQYVGQIEMFFAALAWYLDENPERAKRLLAID